MRVVNIPRSLCLVVGGVMSGALYLGGVMTVNRIFLKETYQVPRFEFILEIDRKMLS